MIVYTYSPDTHLLTGYRLESEEYQLKDNETNIAIPDGIKNLKFENGSWIGNLESDKFVQQVVMQLNQRNVEQVAQIKQLQQLFMQANQQQALAKAKEAVSNDDTSTNAPNVLG